MLSENECSTNPYSCAQIYGFCVFSIGEAKYWYHGTISSGWIWKWIYNSHYRLLFTLRCALCYEGCEGNWLLKRGCIVLACSVCLCTYCRTMDHNMSINSLRSWFTWWTTAYSHQENAVVERANKEVLRHYALAFSLKNI